MLVPDPAPDGLVYLTTVQAAVLAGVSPAAVRRWEKVGYLASRKGPNGRKVWEYGAVISAEYEARMAAIRTSGTDALVRRTHVAA